jgi:NADPH:quinone reductase-like Zn-dependent oxidoreductase
MALNGSTSSTSIPKTMKAWSVDGHNGFDSLTFHPEAPLPEPSDYEVLVKFHATSLNYRDLCIPKGQSVRLSLVQIIDPFASASSMPRLSPN